MSELRMYPPAFVQKIENQLGSEAAAFWEALEGMPTISLRKNPFKNAPLAYPTEAVPWAENGHYLSERPHFAHDPLWHAGAYYVQEASSMFVEYVLKNIVDLNRPLRVLDLCAAPGGKSTLLNSIISDASILVANEVIQSRVSVLQENLLKWGYPNTVITHHDPEDFEPLVGYFDVVLVDAPCSGEGLFRKDPNSVEVWSEKNLQLCSARQKRILASAMKLVKSGGHLIYCTCTYEPSENEQNTQWIQSSGTFSSIPIPIQEEWGIEERNQNQVHTYHFYPHRSQGEGFFISCFQSTNAPPKNQQRKKSKSRKQKITTYSASHFETWLNEAKQFEYRQYGETVHALLPNIASVIDDFEGKLKIKRAGIKLGKYNGKLLVPHHHLAMSGLLSDSIPSMELDKNTALSYLRRQDIPLPLGANKGWHLCTYQNVNLGWAKVLPQRVNNYYPKEWRLRK